MLPQQKKPTAGEKFGNPIEARQKISEDFFIFAPLVTTYGCNAIYSKNLVQAGMGSRKFSEIYQDRTLQIKSLTRLTYFQTCLKTKYFLHYKGKCQVGRRVVQYYIKWNRKVFKYMLYSWRNLESVCNFIFAKKDVVTPFWENGPVSFERYANSSFPCQFRFF